MTIDVEGQEKRQRRGSIFIFITALARISGFITLMGLILLTFLEWLPVYPNSFRYYVTVTTMIVGYLELLWIFDKCVTCCMCCFRTEACYYWICCFPLDNWVKSILYVILAIPLLVPIWVSPVVLTDARIAGVLLLITALLYFIKTFKYTKRIDGDEDVNEDDVFTLPKYYSRPSISTQTSVIGINNDQFSSSFTVDQEIVKKN